MSRCAKLLKPTLANENTFTLARALDEAGVTVIQFLAPKSTDESGQAIKVFSQLSKMKLRAKLSFYGVGSPSPMDLARDHGVEIISYTIFPLPEWQPIYAASRKDADLSNAARNHQLLR